MRRQARLLHTVLILLAEGIVLEPWHSPQKAAALTERAAQQLAVMFGLIEPNELPSLQPKTPVRRSTLSWKLSSMLYRCSKVLRMSFQEKKNETALQTVHRFVLSSAAEHVI